MASSTERSADLPNVHNGKLIDDITRDAIPSETVQPALRTAESPAVQPKLLERTQRHVKPWKRNPQASTIVERWGLAPRNHDAPPTLENIDWNTWMGQLRSLAARRMPWRSPELEAILAPLRTKTVYVQPVYTEQRAERVVVAQDLRGACLYAVGHIAVSDPKTLKRYMVHSTFTPDPDRLVGFVRVRPTLRTQRQQSITGAWLHTLFALDAQPYYWIHTCEWNGWSAWFDLQPDQAILGAPHAHPLQSLAQSLWDEQYATQDPDEIMLAKYMRALVHTACGPRAAQPSEERPLGGSHALWSVHHVPQAWVRGQWMERAAQIEDACSDALLCYANVDSMHYSIPKNEYAKIKPFISTENTPWGAWKTVTIGDQGCWLGRGRYWIKHQGKLIYFQNYGDTRPWSSKRRIRTIDGQRMSLYIWQGLQKCPPLYQKEKHLTIHIPTPLSKHTFSTSLRRVLKDRPWKRKLWYLFQRG